MAADHGGCRPQVFDPPVGARADENAIHRIGVIGVPGSSPCTQSPLRPPCGRPVQRSAGSGTRPPTATTWPGLVPQVTCGSTSAPRRFPGDHISPPDRWAGSSIAPRLFRNLAVARAAFEVAERGGVRRDHARPAPASIDILQTVIRSSMLRLRTTGPVYSSRSRCRRWWRGGRRATGPCPWR